MRYAQVDTTNVVVSTCTALFTCKGKCICEVTLTLPPHHPTFNISCSLLQIYREIKEQGYTETGREVYRFLVPLRRLFVFCVCAKLEA